MSPCDRQSPPSAAPCPVCGKTDTKSLFTDANRRDSAIEISGTYAVCRHCSLVYLIDPPPWEEIVGYYSQLEPGITTAEHQQPRIPEYKKDNPKHSPLRVFWRGLRASPHRRPLHAVPQNSQRLLDIGCASGHRLAPFAEQGFEVWGADVGEKAIEDCRRVFNPDHFHCGEITDADWPDNHFDYIRTDNTLEHVPNVHAVVQACFRLLKPGGRLYIHVPHGRSFTMRWFKGDSVSSWIPFHLQLFTKASLRLLLEGEGFQHIRVKGYTPASWIPLSVVQRRARQAGTVPGKYSKRLRRLCRPLGRLTVWLGMAEELFAAARKPV